MTNPRRALPSEGEGDVAIRSRPRRAREEEPPPPLPKSVSAAWKAVWITEGAVVLLLLSIIWGMTLQPKILEWLG